MSIYNRPDSDELWCDITVKGHRIRRSCKTADPEQAKIFEAKLMVQLWNETVLGKPAEMTLDAAMGRYLVDVKDQPSAINTVRQARRLLERLGKTTLLSAIGDPQISDYSAWRRGHLARGKTAQISGATLNRELELLRRVMRKATRWGIAVGQPYWKDHRRRESGERNVRLSAEGRARLFGELRADYHPLFAAAFASGLRLRNLTGLTWAQVDEAAGRVKVIQKGDREHSLPITGEFAVILQTQRGQHPTHVFTYIVEKRFYDRFGKRWLQAGARQPFTGNGWRKSFDRARIAAGLPEFRFHDQRHCFGNDLYDATKNLKVVQRAMGHEDIRSTMRYMSADDSDVAAGMETMAKAALRVTNRPRKIREG